MSPGGDDWGDRRESGPQGAEEVRVAPEWPWASGWEADRTRCSQETHAAGAGSSPGGSSFVVPGALHVSRPRGHSLLVAGEWPWGQGSRPAGTPLALAHRSVAAPPCRGGGVGWRP